MNDVVIIGAGISGLCAAWELVQRGHYPLVLEASERAGGVILTEHVDGFVIDAGPDALLIQKPGALELCRELGLSDRLIPTLPPRTAFVVHKGRLVPLPEASVLGFPTRLRPFVTTPLFSWRGKVRMAMEPFIPIKEGGAPSDEPIARFIGRRFGREAVTNLAEPLLAGIHAGDVNRLSMRANFPQLAEAEQRYGSVLRGLRQRHREHDAAEQRGHRDRGGSRAAPAFMSFPGGIGELVDGLVARLPAGTIRYGARVSRVAGGGPFAVTLAGGDTLDAHALIVATPAWSAAEILRDVDEDLSGQCASIRYVSSATIVFGLQRAQVGHPLAGTGFVVPRAERQPLMAGTWVTSKWPGRAPDDRVLLRGFVGGACDPGVLEHDDGTMATLAFRDFASRLEISGQPMLTRVYRWTRANPQHDAGHLDRMADLDRRLATLPGLYVTGSGFRVTGIPDCIADGRLVASVASDFRRARRGEVT